eukprot:360874-Chlamydomonas_euryale.AAC.26
MRCVGIHMPVQTLGLIFCGLPKLHTQTPACLQTLHMRWKQHQNGEGHERSQKVQVRDFVIISGFGEASINPIGAECAMSSKTSDVRPFVTFCMRPLHVATNARNCRCPCKRPHSLQRVALDSATCQFYRHTTDFVAASPAPMECGISGWHVPSVPGACVEPACAACHWSRGQGAQSQHPTRNH